MTFSIHGLTVSRGIAIGRAVLVASSRMDVAHYFIKPEEVASEIDRVRLGRDVVIDEINRANLPRVLGELLSQVEQLAGFFRQAGCLRQLFIKQLQTVAYIGQRGVDFMSHASNHLAQR